MGKRDHAKGALSHLGQFVALSYSMMDSPAYMGLSSSAKVLLQDVARQYSGKNNGSLSPCWELMQRRGWRSPATLNNAKKELRATRLITVTKVGVPGVNGTPELWAVNWMKMDWKSDFDIGPRGQDYMGYVELKVDTQAEQKRREIRLIKGALDAVDRSA